MNLSKQLFLFIFVIVSAIFAFFGNDYIKVKYEFRYDSAPALVLLEPDNANLYENAHQFFKIE